MGLITFLLGAVGISLSGVMMPGPMTAVTLGQGTRSPHAGAWLAMGHGIVEYPLMIIIYYGLGAFFKAGPVKTGILAVGSLFLLWMGIGMLRNINTSALEARDDQRSPVLAGILLSIGNPYFLIWWVSVGAALVAGSAAFGRLGFATFTLVHWLCDFFWFWFLSTLAFRGGQFFGKIFQKAVFGVCGIFLLAFSGKFLYDAVVMIVR